MTDQIPNYEGNLTEGWIYVCVLQLHFSSLHSFISQLPQQLQFCKICKILATVLTYTYPIKKKQNYKPNFHLGMHPHFLHSISAKETLRSKMKLGSKMWDNSKNNTTPNMTWRSLKNTEWLGKSAGI